MTRTSILTLAAAALAGSTMLTSAAQAGGGIRLGFGFPLGSFVASPKPGGYAQKRHAQKPASHLVKHHPKYEEPKPEPKARTAKHTPKVETAETPRAKSQVARLETPAAEETSEIGAPVTGTTALTRFTGTQSTPAPAEAEEVAANTAAEPATAPAVTETAKVEEPVKADEAKPEETVATAAEATKGDCKKFIPILGITISVGCGD